MPNNLKGSPTSVEEIEAERATNDFVAVAYSAIYDQDVVLKILMHDTHEIQMLQPLNGQGQLKCEQRSE